MRPVQEVVDSSGVPLWRQPEWAERFSWLVQGVTGAGDAAEPFDLGLSGQQPVGAVTERWRRLRAATGMRLAVHSRQVHGTELREHSGGSALGLLVTEGFDGHLTREPSVLLTVSVADCVPVFLVEDRQRAVSVVHAGWRGVAGGIVERAVRCIQERFGGSPADLWVHCGPAICGRCYEVGPEVHEAVNPLAPAPREPTPIDLRAAISGRVADLGVDPERITTSSHCTRCGPGAFFSHRGGSAARQMGILGRRG